jgi:hypothetical protein
MKVIEVLPRWDVPHRKYSPKMTSLNVKTDHKIFDMDQDSCHSLFRADRVSQRTGERGYTLVALMAVMTLMTLFALAVAPNILQQAQREREKEAIFRGEEVAEAIRLDYAAQKINRGTRGIRPCQLRWTIWLKECLDAASQRSCKCCALRRRTIHFPARASGNW